MAVFNTHLVLQYFFRHLDLKFSIHDFDSITANPANIQKMAMIKGLSKGKQGFVYLAIYYNGFIKWREWIRQHRPTANSFIICLAAAAIIL